MPGLWKALVVLALLLGSFGSWRSYMNMKAGQELTAWASVTLKGYLDHDKTDGCHGTNTCDSGDHPAPPTPPPW